MGVFTRSHKPHGQTVTTTTTTTTRPEGTTGYGRKPTLMQRLKGNHAHKSHTTRTHAAPRAKKTKVARANGTTRNGVPRRKVSVGDKVSGMMLKMKGSLTHRPGEKAAGTRRMHGTDGRGSRRVY
jgi:hypothetical protein